MFVIISPSGLEQKELANVKQDWTKFSRRDQEMILSDLRNGGNTYIEFFKDDFYLLTDLKSEIGMGEQVDLSSLDLGEQFSHLIIHASSFSNRVTIKIEKVPIVNQHQTVGLDTVTIDSFIDKMRSVLKAET